MKILIIATGGTICSSASAENNKNNVNTEKVLPELIDRAEPFIEKALNNDKADYDVLSPINTLSENMTIEDYNKLLACMRDVEYSNYDGVIILHGTDTLHLTAPLISIAMFGVDIPVMLVSGNRIITDPESNAVENFTNAVRVIHELRILSDTDIDARAKAWENVYVIYRNMNQVSYIHRALMLEECGDHSEDFCSVDMCELEEWIKSVQEGKNLLTETAGNNRFAKGWLEQVTSDRPIIYSCDSLKDDVLYIKPYVGINYDRYSLDGVRCVLHGLYHSSTANALENSCSSLSLIRRCTDKNIPVYIYPCNIDSYRYVTTKKMLDAGAIPVNGPTWNAVYMYLLLRLAS